MSKKPILFKDDAESDSDVEIKTNNDYATHYDMWRQKEEMNKLKTKYGDRPYLINREYENDDDSSSSEDDEDARELTAEFEKDFFKTLSCLKNQDPKIYDDKVVFFEDAKEETTTQKKKKKDEPMFLKDYERKMILEKGAKFEESDEEDDINPRSNSPTYVQQQTKLKESLKEALKEDDNDEEQWGGLFSKREKSKEEKDREEEDFKKWLKGTKDQLDNKEEETALKPLKEYWGKPDLDNTEKFLRDYLLNKRYLENEDQNHIPSYEEIIHDSDEGLSEDENQIEKQEEFEHKYNFRFEEPDQDFIKRYPRTMEQSVRKTDDRRKVKRQEIKQRKEEEKKQKQEDLKQLKIYKRKEIEEKIQMLKEITGNEEMAFNDVDLDGDFDPEEHDKRMQQLFNDKYYQGEEGDLKPEFSDLDEELGPWKDNNDPHCEDDDFNMDADFDPSTSAQKKNKKDKKKRIRPGKQTKNSEDIDDLPIDKNDERYEEYMDELYKLDCEDMIGDLPCRFKYRDVLPNDFGLSVEEILLAKDKELNRWCSLKKTTQYRPEHMEKYDALTYRRKAMNDQVKKKLLPSLYDETLLEEDQSKEEQVAAMNKHKNFRGFDDTHEETTKKQQPHDEENEIVTEENANENVKTTKEKKNKKRKEEIVIEDVKPTTKEKKKRKDNEIVTEEKPNEDVKTTKEKKNKKRKTQEENNEIITEETQAENNGTTTKEKKKKKKQKKNEETEEKTSNTEVSQKQPGMLTRRQRKNKKKILTKSKETNTTESKPIKQNRKRKLSNQEGGNSSNPKKKQKLNKTKKSQPSPSNELKISDARLEAYGINPKKYRNKLKYKNKNTK